MHVVHNVGFKILLVLGQHTLFVDFKFGIGEHCGGIVSHFSFCIGQIKLKCSKKLELK